MKITVLVENTAIEGLEAEHGLSLLIEHNKRKYLLDSGQSIKFMNNAKKLSLDIENVDYAVLSHGHYDHGGGFFYYLRSYPDIKVHAMESVFGNYYSSKGGIHEISVPKEIKENFKNSFVLHNEVTKLSEDVFLIPHSAKGLDIIGEKAGLYASLDGKIVPDAFGHEASLVIDEDGLVIFNSCSHGGVVNIINEVKSVFPDRKIKAFVGGLHMMGMKEGAEICTFSNEEIAELTNAFLSEGIEKIHTGHCTGKVGYEKIKSVLGEEKIQALYTGAVITI